MIYRVCAAGVAVFAAIMGVASCTEIPTEANAVLSIAFDSIPSPSVVLGDTLRDSTGNVAPLRVSAFNFQDARIPDARVRFSTRDRGVRVDSITGIVTADSLRSTPARITATVGELEANVLIDVVLRPDTVHAVNGRDSVLYSLTDTTLNVSPPLTVKVLHGPPGDSAVRSYLVSFAVVGRSDTTVARLQNDAGRLSRVDTTDASGIAGRRVRIDAARLTSLVDSVVVHATVRYRGAHVRGSPVRLVVRLRPR